MNPILDTKYPFIDVFVSSLMSFNAHTLMQNNLDIKSLLVFLVLFKDTIKELDYYGTELTFENITHLMKQKYTLDHAKYITDNIQKTII